MLRKIASLFTACLLSVGMQAQDYPVNFPTDQSVTHASRRVNSIALNGATIAVNDNMKVLNVMMNKTFIVSPGDKVKPSIGFNGTWMNAYAYIDRGQDGRFDVAEPNGDGTLEPDNDLVSYSYYNTKNSAGKTFDNGNHLDMPSFTIPEDMPTGYYRMRFKLDWNSIDPGGSLEAGNELVKNGGAVIDVRLKIVEKDAKAIVNSEGHHGIIAFHTGATFNNTKRPMGTDLPVVAYPEEGYKLTRLCIRHGQFTGDSLIHSVPQYVDDWFTASQFNRGKFLIPTSCLDGEVQIEGFFEPLATDEKQEALSWELTFFDEFNLSNGSQPNAKKWVRSPKSHATWNRFISDSPLVVYLQDGCLVTRCVPTPNRAEGSSDMISGAIESRGKYSFQYGRVEARLKTTKHKGNFPAFWMMPEDRAGGWPTCGEIDIFETIDTQDRAWHTVHSHWTYDLNKTNEPQSSGNEWMDVGNWHIYAFEWEAEEMRWYVDDKLVFTYRKSTDDNALENGQWPFDKAFHLILNQSVGNGAWAANHDADFTYETLFDWVRVYQLKPTKCIPTGIESPQSTTPLTQNSTIYDLSGLRVTNPRHGIYIQNGKKVVF